VHLRRIRPVLIGVPLVFAAWVVSMLAVTLFASAGVPVAVVARGGASSALAAVVAADGDILQVRGDAVIAVSDDAGFVARLYRAGALAVVQAQGGCGFAVSAATSKAAAAPTT
jgi:hypothetical protein